MTSLDTRPPGLDLIFRPGNTVVVVLTWPANELDGRTFTATLADEDLEVDIDGDVMTVTASGELTDDVLRSATFLLTEGDEDRIVGRWQPLRSGAPGTALHEITVHVDEIAVAVTVLGGPAAGS